MQTKKLSLIASLLLMAGAVSLKAASGTWTNDASGTWSGTGNWLNGIVADASGSTADFSTINITANRTVTLDAAHTLTTLKFGDALPDFNWALSGANTLTLAGTTPTINVLNQGVTISSVIAGTVGLTKAGAGTLTLGGATDAFTGGLVVSGGTLTLDYNASGSPVSTLVPSQVLTLGGGTLNINGNAGAASSQSFSSITMNPGLSIINAAPASGANNPTLTFGAWTANRGALVRFIGPATIGAGNASVPATATITTTTVGSGAPGGILLGEGPAVANPTAAFGTVGLYDWASTSLASGAAGTSPYTILGGSQVTGFYNTAWGFNNVDVTSSLTAMVNNSVACSVRFNDPTAISLTTGGGGNLLFYGVLVTPNLGAHNASFTGGGTWQITRITNPNGAQTGTIWQNNTLGYFIMTPVIADGRDGSSDAVQVAKGGDGTVTLASGSTYTGTTYVNGGNLLITANNCLGSAASGTTAQLNGGTIVADGGSFALDNGGNTPKRGITLLGNGGGLAATAGNTLTIDGVVAGANGTGPLTIGIPASSANGNVAGLLPGSGSIASGQAVDTANLTPVFATGTVVLNFPNGASGNTFFGGVNIVGGATLNINSQYALGGANQGPTVFNGGTLQYNSTLATGAAGTALDISGQPVTFTGNATIDLNTLAVTYANAIGKGGSGALTVLDSVGGGSLTLTGGGNFTNTTTVGNGANAVTLNVSGPLASRSVAVTSGATFGGSGAVAGNVTWAFGATALFDAGSPMIVAGTATLNNNTVVVNVPGAALTALGSPYTLLTATSIAGGSTVSSVPTMTGAGLAGGFTGTVSISGNSVILTVTGSGVTGTWTDGNATEKWSEAGNWSGGVPKSAGDLASFGSGGVGLPVNLNTNETVGVISFNNGSSYTIIGTNVLTLDNSANGAAITATAGTANAINTSISLNDNVTATVASGTLVTLGGTVTNASTSETLTATGAGTVVLSQANSYGPSAGSVGTTLGGATLRVGNNGALGAGDVNVTANSILQAGTAGLNLANNISMNSANTLTVDDSGNTFTLGGTITGIGAVTKIGNGTLALAGNNSYSGNTTVNAGVLSLAAANLASSTVVLNGGDLLGNGTFAMANNIGVGAISGATPGTALIDAASGQTLELDGVIASAGNTGANNLTVNALASAPGTVVLGGANTFKGTTTISNGVLQLANPLALQASTLNYNNQGGALSFGTLSAATLGGLTGTQNLSLLNTTPAGVALTVANTITNTYAGGLSGTGGSLAKAGAGTFILTGTNNYSGSTTVSAGVLQLNPTGVITNGSAAGVSANGAAQLAVSGGSFTAGSLAIANPSLGLLVSSGSAVINGNVTLNSGNAASDSLIAVTGGFLTATNLTIGRSSVSSGTQPATGDTTRGFYVNGGTVNVISNLVVGAANANSAVSARMDSGTLAVGGTLTIGLNNGGRWAVLDINGGTLTINDTTTGVSLGQSVSGNAELIVRNGTATVGKLSFGQGATVETAVLSLANLGALYVGIGGIEQVSTGVGFVSTITLGDGTLGHGTLGAAGDWLSSLPMTLAGATIKTADSVGNPHNITLNGTLSGTTLTKTGNGTLILGAANTYTGSTTISAGTLALSGSGAIDTTPLISVAGGTVFDVSALGSGFTLASGQILSNSASATGIISGNLNTGNGIVSLSYAAVAPSLTVTNGTFTLASGTIFNVNNTGAALSTGSYKLISTNLNGSGLVSGSPLPAVTVGGNGVSGAGTSTLQITNSELYLVVASGVNTNPTNLTALVTGSTLSLTWPGDHLGWTLQTNSVDLANTNDWFAYPGSASVTNVNITIDPAKASVFYRLVYP